MVLVEVVIFNMVLGKDIYVPDTDTGKLIFTKKVTFNLILVCVDE